MTSRGKKRRFDGKGRFKNFPKKDNKTGNTPKREFRHIDQLSECEVGISEYINDLEGFTGVLKARYSDFHVNEIDLNGDVAILTNTDIPKVIPKQIDFQAIEQTPIETLPQTIWEELKELVVNNVKDKVVKLDVTDLSKDDRKTIHVKIKECFGNRMVADTVLENEKKFLSFKVSTADQKTRCSWNPELPSYVYFLLYKEGIDTMNACYQVAEALRLKASLFTYAGLKDRRGKTTQWFCVRQVDPWKLIIKTKKLRHIKIGNIKFVDKPLKLGDLTGNRFKIVLKNVVCEDPVIVKAIENVKNHGYINYYGLQRFGNDKEVPTYSIGLQLLLGNWKEACDLILKVKTSDEPELDISQAKKVYSETEDAGNAIKCLKQNKNNCVEAKLLEGLAKEHKNAVVNALDYIPRSMRLFYIHSFQSFIWNMMVSKRIKKFGFQPVENDLVVINDVFVEPLSDISDISDDVKLEEEDEQNSEKAKPIQQVKALTQSELSNYSIFDIVLPLPGYDIQYPENMREDYKEVLEKYGLTLEMPKQSVKTYTLSGAYRKFIGRVKNFEYKLMKYNDPNASLVLSDFDILRKFEEPSDIPDGKYKAVIMQFDLDSSSYATMVLREMMKIDTSPSAQTKLNDYAGGVVLDGAKKIASTEKNAEENLDTIENDAGSLLKDQQKLEEFKKSIFADMYKRKNEEEEEAKKRAKIV